MGCSTSSHTSAVDSTRPSPKPGESNGTSTTGAANENGAVAEDSETIPDQALPENGDANPADEPAVAATSAGSTAATPPAGEDPEPAAASPPADAAAPAEHTTPETEASSTEPAAPEQAEATATDSEPKTDEAPAPSE
ncbi:myristoylated alanine-rich C-kinase substrate isoform X2 [Anabas testudineus]|uniref:myristoylated alanine-rich C-kinase substrate isoform X2 n=1 Tax=Anabas testudineus TaxID=64144 RepID=UPI000E4624E6|nr:myristoylated alanine-rich C-kinase substrate isoform X2 [Anabas testudineus]